ncbi:AAA family ATPase [Solirubrobacter ginsenosidimutans]|uniref:AAA family ATPase n=1 Tax=Solirubrobacter ginsenosidimutans TaxID=490573 RepID=A0A9X3N216_9ACTN|nr:LuxR family transcriptional regulator [Solirubrobacter ginsenosidimutans]MDA0167059.1 AAA family ATPase [Solirubrobacter ginsenosidimutans]
MTARPPPVLLGRAAELELLERMLRNVHGGQSAVLVIRGEAGVGKTALVDRYAAHASAFRVARVAGVEAEMEFPFAAVHQLCARMLDRLDVLPEPQRDALSVALGLSPGPSPDRFLVALAVLSLLSATAEERPLLCVVDDAQWLDRASGQILGFVARRLLAESVALVFAVREPAGTPELEGLPALLLTGLGEDDARALLASVPGRLDDEVRDRIIAEMRGNPLALLELPQRTLAGGFSLPAGTDLPDCLEQQYMERVRGLPAPTQRLLLLAAAEPAGDATLLWRAAEILGIGAGDAAPAEEEALVEGGMRFRHPLVRSAAYRTGSPEERRIVHAALAEASDPIRAADRRAWHRALAASEPDEEVAAELERSAGRAHVRGGFAAAATLLERAVELTPDPASRAQRALAAADTKLLSEDSDAALRLLGQAEAGPLTPLARAHGRQLRGRIAFGSRRGREAPPLLLAAARELEALDPELAWDTYLVALLAALLVGRMADEVDIQAVAQAVRAASPLRPRPQDLLLQALAVAITDGQGVAAPLLKEAVGAFRTVEMPDAQVLRLLGVAIYAAEALWDEDGMLELSRRCIALARQTGALRALPITLGFKVRLHLFSGELGAAASLVDEIAAIAAAIGRGLPPYSAVALAAFRGDEAEAAELIRAVRAEAGARGDGYALTLVDHAEGVLYNGLGHYRKACEAARRGAAHPHELALSTWSLPELIESAVRSDQPELAEDAMQRLARSAGADGTDWAPGIVARSRALVSEDGDAEALYQDALDRLGRTRLRAELARAHLLYGEWLRRQARRVDAREQLRAARRMFTEMGMEAFAERARRELIATGETVRKRAPEFRDELTPQEEHIAQLARGGLTNAEIGGQLFLSPRTVEWHLKKVFGKLGISSRRALHDALPT